MQSYISIRLDIILNVAKNVVVNISIIFIAIPRNIWTMSSVIIIKLLCYVRARRKRKKRARSKIESFYRAKDKEPFVIEEIIALRDNIHEYANVE